MVINIARLAQEARAALSLGYFSLPNDALIAEVTAAVMATVDQHYPGPDPAISESDWGAALAALDDGAVSLDLGKWLRLYRVGDPSPEIAQLQHFKADLAARVEVALVFSLHGRRRQWPTIMQTFVPLGAQSD